MNDLMIFEGKQVEVFEYQGMVLFNPYHCGECLDISAEGVRKAITRMNGKQVVKLKNSDVTNCHIRKLNNAGENFLTESGVYKLIFKSHKKEAERFQDWVTDEVLPQIRKNGVYQINAKGYQQLINNFKAETMTMVDDIVLQKINEIEEKCSVYFRPSSLEKRNISHYIIKRLGVEKANEEYELVKERVLIKLGATKWEDVPIETLKQSLNLIDESIRVIKADRVSNQISIFD